MKINHNLHGWTPDNTDPEWAERVEREAQRTTERTEARWRKAQRRLERAVTVARQAEARTNVAPKRLARMWDAVEQRRAELREIERLMTESPAGAQHRGTGSHRGVNIADIP